MSEGANEIASAEGTATQFTLADFIREQQDVYKGSGAFSSVLHSIALGVKIVSQGINRAGLASMLGLAGSENVQGEEVKQLDVYSDIVFSNVLGRSGEFISMVSEERENMFQARAGGKRSRYVIAFDPLDGSSNIDVNVAIGSIWGIYRRVSDGWQVDPLDTSDYLQPGYLQVAAGYALYGSSTMFVFSTGHGVSGFTLDPSIGEFILTHPDMTIPEDGNIYSCNEANLRGWHGGVQRYVDEMKNGGNSARYVGSLVSDFHRTLIKGGIYLYPGDSRKPQGKLRLLYECAPLAFLAEQAGGRASDGKRNVLSVVPQSIHQRCSLFIGSKNMVARLEQLIAEEER